ncbi:MAG TPA: Fic family protein [Candidatus Nanoarchaeia archaeon]|nr:Fic family protein [Candidatus Nanoarchaeia archaeon]
MYKPSKKDLIVINQTIGELGNFSNEGSLDFALSLLKQRKPWLHELSYLVRSLLVDHAFQDGNKRTALAAILTYFANYEVECDEQKMTETVYKIAKKGVKDINKIVRLMEDGILRR